MIVIKSMIDDVVGIQVFTGVSFIQCISLYFHKYLFLVVVVVVVVVVEKRLNLIVYLFLQVFFNFVICVYV